MNPEITIISTLRAVVLTSVCVMKMVITNILNQVEPGGLCHQPHGGMLVQDMLSG